MWTHSMYTHTHIKACTNTGTNRHRYTNTDITHRLTMTWIHELHTHTRTYLIFNWCTSTRFLSSSALKASISFCCFRSASVSLAVTPREMGVLGERWGQVLSDWETGVCWEEEAFICFDCVGEGMQMGFTGDEVGASNCFGFHLMNDWSCSNCQG